MEYAQSAIGNLRGALEREGVRGLDWEEIPVDTERLPELRHRASGAIRVTFAVPYDAPHGIRTLVAHALERGVWLDVSRLAVRPLGHLRIFSCVLDLVLSDPRIAFQSSLVRQRLAGVKDLGRQYQSVAEVLVGEFERHTESLPEGKQRDFRKRLETFLRCDGREADAAAFEDELDESIRPVMVDLRLYVDLPRSHRRAVEDLDRWIERERVLPRNAVRGKTFYRQPWPAFSPTCAVHENPEVRPGEPSPSPDPEALFRMAADESVAQLERQDALLHLQSLRSEEAQRFCVRALGYDGLRLTALEHAVGMPRLAPFFRALILESAPGRILDALDRMREYSGEPSAAWAFGEVIPRPDARGEIYQEAVLASYARTGDREVIPRLIEELNSRARTPGWIAAALQALREFRATEAAEAALTLALRQEWVVRGAALEFFETVDYPRSVPVLLAALEDPELATMAAAERGLSGQISAGWAVLLRALDRIHHRAIAIPARSADDGWRNRLGATLLRTLAVLPGSCPDAEAVRRSTRRIAVEGISGVRRLLGEEESGRLVRESEIVGSSPEATFVDRMRLWASRGYAVERYRADGHRDPSWDPQVEKGHGLYDPENPEQSEEAARGFEEAVRRGCEDGMVHYRLAVCRHTRGDLAGARRGYESALLRLSERYPGCPYVLCAEAALGQMARNEGRPEEALERYRRTLLAHMAIHDVREQLPDLEEEIRAVRTGESLRPLDTGDLAFVPGRRHSARVTSLEIAADGRAILSADESGFVQVSRIAEDRPPAVEPRARSQAHAAGRTLAAWLAPLERLFATGGADGLVRRGRYQPGRALELVTVAHHDVPIDALVRLSSRGVAFADAEGRIFVLDGNGGKPRPLQTAWRARIRALLSDAGRLVAVDADHGVQVWTLPADGTTEWSERLRREIVFADLCSSGLLYLGTDEETVRTFRLESGLPGRTLTVPRGSSLARFGRFDVVSRVAVWGYASGCVRVETGGTGFHVATEPLAALDVSFPEHLVAWADAHGFLHVQDYGG